MADLVIEQGLLRHLADAKVGLLRAAGLPAMANGKAGRFDVVVQDVPLARQAVSSQTLLLDCHRIILEEARRQDLRIESYKPLDNAEIVAAFARASAANVGRPLLEQAARLWHELVWAQGLPNGNHRSALLLLGRWFNTPAEPTRFHPGSAPGWSETLVRGSKPLILDKEFAPDQMAAKAKHLDWCLQTFRDFPVNRASGR